MSLKVCLNHSDPEVIKWFDKVGPDETYRQYVQNGYFLPTYKAYKNNSILLRGQKIRDFLSTMLPVGAYKFENISKIMNELPTETQAAFWKNTFYFKDQVDIAEASEEGFHAIIETILSAEQRKEFYEIGEKLLGNKLKETIAEYTKLYPITYNTLTEVGKKERVIEEYFANEFVNWYRYGESNLITGQSDRAKFKERFGVFGDFIYELFDTIRSLFSSSASNRNYIETLFAKIKNGEFKNSVVVDSDNVTPSTYNLIGAAPSGLPVKISSSDTIQMVNNLVGAYFHILQTSNLKEELALEKAIKVGQKYYSKNPTLSNIFIPKILGMNEETFEDEEVDNDEYLKLKAAIKERAYETNFLNFEELEDENGPSEYEFSDSSGADERGFDSISTWLKQYIKTVGIEKAIVDLDGELIPFYEVVDERKLYYGVARALNNSKNDTERLIRLIRFSKYENSEAARAFVNKLIKDGTGKSENTQQVADQILTDYLKDGTIDINKYFNSSRTYVIQNILKGFNLWSRTNIFQRIIPSKGESITSNANVNNSINTQVSNWQQNHLGKDVNNVKSLDDLVVQINKVSNNTADKFEAELTKSVKTNQAVLSNSLGVEVSVDALKWLLLTEDSPVYASTKASYNSVKNEIYTFATQKEIDGLLGDIKTLVNEKNYKELYDAKGIKSKLNLLAQINALFDENVFESSYKNAEDKTIYGFQYKTYDLEFVSNIQDKAFLGSLMKNGITSYRTDKDGNPVWLNESQDFLHNNLFLKELVDKSGTFKDTALSKILPYFKLESIDGLRQDEFGQDVDGVTFSNMTTDNFDLMRLNIVVSRTQEVNGKVLYPHYLGNLEAKRTADFVYLPEINSLTKSDELSAEGIKLLKEEIRKEYDRIKRVHRELASVVEDIVTFDSNGEGSISTKSLRAALGKDVYEKYHTGVIKRTEIKENVGESGDEFIKYIYKSKGNNVRALQFSDSVSGVLPKSFMKAELTDAALEDVDFNTFWNSNNLDNTLKNHWKNEIFKTHLDRLTSQGNIQLLDNRWKIDGKLDTQKFNNFIVSSFVNVLAFNQMMHGDPALLYKNDGADMPKRFGGRNAAIQNAETYLIAPELGITEARTIIKYVVGTEFVNKVAYETFKVDENGIALRDKNGDLIPNTIDQADAQNYSTTEYKRYLLWSRGKLNKFLASILDKIDQGIPLTESENRKVIEDSQYLNVDKTVGFNGVQYLKKSDFMLTKEFTSRLKRDVVSRINSLSLSSENDTEIRNLRTDENNWEARPGREFHHNLRQNMEGWRNVNDILEKDNSKRYDLYMPISASKMLNINVFDFENSSLNEIDDSIVHIEAKDYGLQLENPAGKQRIIDPSQMLEIIFNEQDDTVKVYYDGKLSDMTTLENEWQNYLTQRDESMYSIARNEIFDANDKFDPSTFFKKVVTTLANSGADSQTISVYELENGKPIYNPNMGITKDKFAALYFAHISKGILQQKVSGDALAHVSSYGIKPLKRIVKYYTKDNKEVFHWEVIRTDSDEYNNVTNYINLELEKNATSTVYDPTQETDELRETLKKLYEEAQGNAVYFTDELRHLKPRYDVDENGIIQGIKGYFSESVMPLYNSKMNNLDENNKYMFGTRIPSQDKHSAVNVEWVDTIPTYYGNSIMTAKEIVTISGSDFDIDKLFLIKPEFYNYKGRIAYYGQNDYYTEYIAFLNSAHNTFRSRYLALVESKSKKDIQAINDVITIIEEEILETDAQLNLAKSEQDINELKAVLDSLNSELYQSNLLKDARIAEWKEKNQSFKLDVADLLEELRLPATDSEIKSFKNPYVINNKLLELRQLGLTNDSTLLPKDGKKAIYKTSATMSALDNVKNDEMFIKPDGTNVFDSTNELPFHTFATHSIVHSKVVTGKQNITPFVNGNLGLILAKRAGIEVNDAFQIKLNGYKISGFNNISADNQRVFDILSTLISAATDEAKEQLNARYNLTLDGAVLLKTMVALGLPLNTSVAFVNQPVIQKFLKLKRDNFQSVYLERSFNSEEDIIQMLVGTLNRPFAGDYGNTELGSNVRSEMSSDLQNQFDKRLLTDMLIFDSIGKQMDKLSRFVKLKKGFTDGFRQLDLLNDAVEELGFYLSDPKKIEAFKKANPLDTYKLLQPEVAKKIPQTINYIKNVRKDQNKLTQDVFFERIPLYKEFKQTVADQLKSMSEKKLAQFSKDVDSFMYVDLYLDKVKDDSEMLSYLNDSLFTKKEGSLTVGQQLLEIKSKIKEVENKKDNLSSDEQVYQDLQGLSLLNRLKVKDVGNIQNVVMNTFSKVSILEQDDLINSFRTLTEVLQDLSDERLKSFPKRLFAYFVVKDAFQVKAGSISKLFPIEMFKDHSNSLEMALAGISRVFNTLQDDYTETAKEFLEKYVLSSSNMNNLKNLNNGFIKNPPLQGFADLKTNTFDIAELNRSSYQETLLREALDNYAFKYEIKTNENGFSKAILTNLPIFVTKSVSSGDGFGYSKVVRKLEYVELEGEKILYEDKDFYNIVLNQTSKITKFEYSPYKTVNNTNQSIFTYKDSDYAKFNNNVSEPTAEEIFQVKKENQMSLKSMYKLASSQDVTNFENNAKPSAYTNYSGAAKGGDTYWEDIGKEFKIGKQVNYIPDHLKRLNESQLKEVEDAYQEAVRNLGRKPLNKDTYAGGLVRRDYLQAKAADAIFAISTILQPNQVDKKGYKNNTNREIVEGGTGYAVQMAINLNKLVYIFDQNKDKWFTWNGENFIETVTPTLTKKFAGIGTREINEKGIEAIRNVYEKTFNFLENLPGCNTSF